MKVNMVLSSDYDVYMLYLYTYLHLVLLMCVMLQFYSFECGLDPEISQVPASNRMFFFILLKPLHKQI